MLRSRQEYDQELYESWLVFEEKMRQHFSEHLLLSKVITRFAHMKGLDTERIHRVLKVRHAVVYKDRKVSLRKVRIAIAQLQDLMQLASKE